MVQALLWILPRPVTVVLPLRPSLTREPEALAIAGEAPPLDRPRFPQQEEWLRADRRRAAASAAAEARASSFREAFMRTTREMLAVLRPEQVRFLAGNARELDLRFEASYWQTLRDRLSEPAAGAPSRRGSTAATRAGRD